MTRPPAVRLLQTVALLLLATAAACARREPLTAARADELVRARLFRSEPVYAEVPQRVWWDVQSPRDAYDEKALATLENLERAGLLTLTRTSTPGAFSCTGRITPKGFRILGTAPSARGPCFRARICEKRYDGLRNFERHPTDPFVGHADLVWHYANPTPLYASFETRIDKPLDRPFASYVSFYYRDHEWHFDITVRKVAQ